MPITPTASKGGESPPLKKTPTSQKPSATRSLRLVSEYLHEMCQCSFLPYEDYSLIESWLQKSGDVNRLLLVLSDVLEEYYERKQQYPANLRLIHYQVLRRLAIS